jgi:uncharacterized protein YgfB (UPF0149 family)
MSAPALPDFQRTIRLSQGNLDAAELAECHGVLCGLLCRELARTANDYIQHLLALKLLVQPGDAVDAVLGELFESTVQQLADEEMGFALWLPDDEEPLEERTIALAKWCMGFLTGLASGGEFDALSVEASEAIEDLQQIAHAELTAAESGVDDNEDDEEALTEIIEYVRIVALMMREDFRGPGSSDAIH